MVILMFIILLQRQGQGFDVTLQPAHIYGTAPSNIGTWLMGYGGLSNGTDDFIQVFIIYNPLNSPTFQAGNVSMGNIDFTSSSMAEAPQSGSATNITTNDRRALDAAWRNDKLWFTTQVMPPSGANNGQATALWARFSASNSTFSFDMAGEIGGEDISTGAYTYMPSLAINSEDNVGIAFSASNSSIFAGSYAVGVFGATGVMTSTVTVQAGTDDYVRTFGGDNRYGDYTRMALDPSDDGFWSINQAAIANGNSTTTGGVTEDGQWQIFIKELEALDNLLPVELVDFTATAREQTAILKWTTATEKNNYGFVVEQFITENFEEVGFVEGAGTTLEAQSYQFDVPNLAGGTHLFRLRQVDFDGMEYLSDVKSVKIEGLLKNTVTLPTPNPFEAETRFVIDVNRTQKVSIQIFDIHGRLVQSLHENVLEQGKIHPFIFNGATLSTGIYTIRVIGEDFDETHKVILNR